MSRRDEVLAIARAGEAAGFTVTVFNDGPGRSFNTRLDDPLPVQYARWLRNALTGHFGTSYQHGIATADPMAARIPSTLMLSGRALGLAVVLELLMSTCFASYQAFERLETKTPEAAGRA